MPTVQIFAMKNVGQNKNLIVWKNTPIGIYGIRHKLKATG